MKQPKVSIVIPVYNVEEYIFNCLQSVERQTYKGLIECIVVDDCGYDNSITIAEQFIAKYKGAIEFKIAHRKQNGGLSAARNTGTKEATGDYVYYLDSDDYISDDCIEKLVEPLCENYYDIVIGDYSVVGNDWGIPKLYVGEGEYSSNILSLYCAGKIYMMAWNKLVRKDFIEKNNLSFKEGIVHEDDHFSFRAFSFAGKIYVVHHTTYYYLVREGGIMNLNKYTQRNRDSYAETLMTIAEYVGQNHEAPQIVSEWLNNRYLKLVVQISQEQHISFYEIYKRMRKIYSYPVIALFRNKQIKKGKFMMRFHYALSIPFGYVYLWGVSKWLGYDKI